MYARVEREGSRAARAQRAPVRPQPSAAAIAALQRSAGNAAATRLLQRELEITDTEQTFTDPKPAAAYLLEEYRKVHKGEPGRAAGERLQKLANAAMGDTVTETKLPGALASIHSNQVLDYKQYLREPWRSPKREDPPDWGY